MSQFNAGETISLTLEGSSLQLKIEDASKSECISAKVEASDSPTYHVGQVYEFDRQLLRP